MEAFDCARLDTMRSLRHRELQSGQRGLQLGERNGRNGRIRQIGERDLQLKPQSRPTVSSESLFSLNFSSTIQGPALHYPASTRAANSFSAAYSQPSAQRLQNLADLRQHGVDFGDKPAARRAVVRQNRENQLCDHHVAHAADFALQKGLMESDRQSLRGPAAAARAG